MTVEFFEVALGGAIDVGQFVYNPGTAEKSDQTEDFLHSITAAR